MVASTRLTSAALGWSDTSDLIGGYPIWLSGWAYYIGSGQATNDVIFFFGLRDSNINLRCSGTGSNVKLQSEGPSANVTISVDGGSTTWKHYVCASRSSTDHELYVNGVSAGTSSTDTGSWDAVPDNCYVKAGEVSTGSSTQSERHVAYFKCGTDSITDAMALELYNNESYLPPNIFAYYPLLHPVSAASDFVDVSPNGRHGDSITGSPAAAYVGPPVVIP